MDLSVIIPCKNEAGSLPSLCEELVRTFSSRKGLRLELVFVNDGSTDDTSHALEAVQADGRMAHTVVVTLSRNFGKEPSMLAGLQQATGDYLAFMDADLQQSPKTLLAMYDLLIAHQDECDVVAAYQSRRKGGLRAKLSSCFYGAFNSISETRLEPDASDFRVFKRCVAEALLAMPEYSRFTKGLFSWVGFRTRPFEYEPDERYAGHSKWSLGSLLHYATTGFVAFSSVPLLFSAYVGALFALIGFVYIIFVFIDAMVLHNTPAGYPTIVSLLLIVGGLILLSLGIIGEYLSHIYMEGKHRPIYIARQIRRMDEGRASERGVTTNATAGNKH